MIAGAASAVPLPYPVVQAESNLFARISVDSSIDVEPGLAGLFSGTPGGTRVDVGIPEPSTALLLGLGLIEIALRPLSR